MVNDGYRLARIPFEAQKQIFSSVQITSLNDVIIGLVQNSLDADARRIDIRFDYVKGYCSVLDDGRGITKEEFSEGGHLAELYYTSKPEDANIPYGRYGRFLCSLINMGLVSIASCCKIDDLVYSAVYKDGKKLATHTDLPDEYLGVRHTGTRVVVHDLFGKMPVRAKHRHLRFEKSSQADSEFFDLRKVLAALVLTASQPLTLDVQSATYRYLHKPTNAEGWTQTPFTISHVASTFYQAGLVEFMDLNDWRQVTVETSDVSARATINLRPSASRNGQIITVNQHPLSQERAASLFQLTNSLFTASTFGIEPVQFNQSKVNPERQSLQRTKGVHRWPTFYIQIWLRHWTSTTLIADSIRIMVVEFLQSHGFHAHARHRKQTDLSTKRNVASVSGFGTWSRTKSASSTPTDVLTGLPFLLPTDNQAETPDTGSQNAMPSPDAQGLSDSQIIKWRNPRSGQDLYVNSRTGMFDQIPVQPLASIDRSSKTVTEVAENLKDKPCKNKQSNQALKTVTPVSSSSLVSNEHLCMLHSGSSVYISGPASGVDPTSCGFTRTTLHTANVLGQVDGKFILASIQTNDVLNNETKLILIDQHAADERIKVEDLYGQICRRSAVSLTIPITFEVNEEEACRFRDCRDYFASWDIVYTLNSSINNRVQVSALPEPIAERCRLEPKLLINLLRKEIWQDSRVSRVGRPVENNNWLSVIGTCPQGVLEMLASRACRSAVMFNDELSIKQCQAIVSQLGDCLFPFRCAHGRPTLTLVARMQDVGVSETKNLENVTFKKAWKAWMNV